MRFRAFISRLLVGALLIGMALPATLTPGGTAAAAAGNSEATVRKEKLHPNLRKQVDSAAPDARFTVIIRGREMPNLDAVKFRNDDAVAALKAAATKSQGPIVNYLRARNAQVHKQFWLINAIVAEVDKPTLHGLLSLNEVSAVFDNFAVSAPPVSQASGTAASDGLTWGVEKIQAHRVWSELGFDGTGIRVAVLDTGIDLSHPDLAGKMHSDNPGDPLYPGGWAEFDGNGNQVASEPHDSDAHGTHVSGTVAGGSASGTAIGVAPGATLMHGLVLPGGGGTFAQVVAGMQWAVEPTDASGNPAGERPHIASMSFGAGGLRDEVVEPIRNMYFSGVLPIAAIGNCGERCVGSPGAVYEAFGIGASAIDDSIAGFSSGDLIKKSGWANPPEEWPDQWIKPDISAPGANVLSAVPGGGYQAWDGTSMATPHVSGAAALMLSANPGLSPDMILETLADTSFFDPRYGEERPNIRYGWGRIDAFEAVSRVAYNSGITGTVTDAATGAPLDQATVTVEGTSRSAKTKADGTFNMVLPAGVYTLKVERFGYASAMTGAITVLDGQKATASVALNPLPTGMIQGHVRYARTGSGIPGVVAKVNGVPIKIEAQTNVDGAYSLRLPVGSYSLSYGGYGFGAVQAKGITVQEDGVTIHDVGFEALPRIAVVGDIEGIMTRFLIENGYLAEATDLSVRHNLDAYSAVIVNMPDKASPDDFMGLVDAAEAAGTGLIFTKGYWLGWGIDLLSQYYGDPVSSSFNWFYDGLEGEVVNPHDQVLPEYFPGGRMWLMDCCPDVAWFDGYSGDVLVDLHNYAVGRLGNGIGIKQNPGNRHVLLASFGVHYWMTPSQWSYEAQRIVLNAIGWAARPEGDGPKFVTWDLKATPDTVLWYQPVTATVGVKNIGDGDGTRNISLMVNGKAESIQAVSLGADQHQTVSFAVQREPVGSYKLQVGHLSAAFRVRPPQVTVNARSLYLPPSGRGRTADPGEPSLPLAGATVDLVRGGKVISRGSVDADGIITFDSTASRDSYTIVVRATNFGYNTPRHYLLTQNVTVEDDTAFTFTPETDNATMLDLTMDARNPSHRGTVFLASEAMGNAAFEFPTGRVVASPGAYRMANVMAYDVPGAQWAYASEWRSMNLAAGSTQTYRFGGTLALRVDDVRGQQAPEPSIAWGMADAYGNQIAAIYKVTAGAFGAAQLREVTDVSNWPATVAATAKVEQKPVLTLTSPVGAIVQTGTVGWAERPRSINMAAEQVLTGDYGLLLQADTGPYMGQLQAQAKLMLPARSLSRTMVMPGDTFDVTVVFDAGQSGQMSLSESLPAGFTITKQSSQPVAAFSGSTWTWQPSGKNSYRAGQTIRVTYTVRVGPDVAAGTYNLTGTVGQSGASRMVAGPQSIQVVR